MTLSRVSCRDASVTALLTTIGIDNVTRWGPHADNDCDSNENLQKTKDQKTKDLTGRKKVAHMPSSANCEITTFIIFLRMGTPGTNFSFLHFELNTVFTCSAKADWSSVICYWSLEAQACTPRLVSFRSLIQNFQ